MRKSIITFHFTTTLTKLIKQLFEDLKLFIYWYPFPTAIICLHFIIFFSNLSKHALQLFN